MRRVLLDESEDTTEIDRRSLRRKKRFALGSGMGRLGPYSRAIDRGAVGSLLDARSREGRFLRRYEKNLYDHVGGNPTIVERALISRASRVALHLELMDERSLAEGTVLGLHDHQHYVAWSNSLARILGRLGLKGAPLKTDENDLSVWLANRAARQKAEPGV
jgi:hypothetical protein